MRGCTRQTLTLLASFTLALQVEELARIKQRVADNMRELQKSVLLNSELRNRGQAAHNTLAANQAQHAKEIAELNRKLDSNRRYYGKEHLAKLKMLQNEIARVQQAIIASHTAEAASRNAHTALLRAVREQLEGIVTAPLPACVCLAPGQRASRASSEASLSLHLRAEAAAASRRVAEVQASRVHALLVEHGLAAAQ